MDLILITSKRFVYTSLVSYFDWNLILGYRKEIHTYVRISWTFPYCHFWIKHWQQPYEHSMFGSSWLHLRNEMYTHLCSLHAHTLTWAFTMITWTPLSSRSSQDSLIICSTMHGTKKLIIYGHWISTAVTYIGNRYCSKNRGGTLSYQEQALGHQGKHLLMSSRLLSQFDAEIFITTILYLYNCEVNFWHCWTIQYDRFGSLPCIGETANTV